MEKTKTKISDYISSLEPERSKAIARLHEVISENLPHLSQVMWEGVFWGGTEQKIIGYGEYTYVGSNKKPGQWFVIGLANQKNYMTIFLNAVEGREYMVEKYAKQLGKVKAGKSAINFTKLEDLNLDEFIALIKRGEQAMKEKYEIA